MKNTEEEITLTNRRKSRELVLQALFQLEFTNSQKLTASLKRLQSLFKIEPQVIAFATELANYFDEYQESLETQLQSLSKNWSVDRMATVDKNILRMALIEIKYIDDIPPNVTMNEAIEIAKKYGSTDSSSFVNGILDQAVKG